MARFDLDVSKLLGFRLGGEASAGQGPGIKTGAKIGAASSDPTGIARLIVTTTNDVVSSADGLISLREAINAANNGTYGSTVSFDGSLAGGILTLTSGEIDITGDVKIQGLTDAEGAANVTIDGNDASRIFNVTDVATAELENLTLTNGNSAGNGGAVYSQGSLKVANSAFLQSYSGNNGGAIGQQGGNLAIYDTSFSDNTGKYFGGAIASVSANLLVSRSTISGNDAANGGGGLFVATASNPGGYTVLIADSQLSENTGDEGGAISSYDANLQLMNSTVSDNSAGLSGGGLRAYGGSVTLENSTVSGNYALASGGGIYGYNATIDVIQSTVDSNDALNGGGIYSYGQNLTLRNSTVSGNTAFYGGGIYSLDATGASSNLTVYNSTLSGNYSDDRGGALNFFGSTLVLSNATIAANASGNIGGGIYSAVTATVLGVNTTITGNYAGYVGGGIYALNSISYFYNSLIVGNGDSYYGNSDVYSTAGFYGSNNLVGFFNEDGVPGAIYGNDQISQDGGATPVASIFAVTNSFIDIDGSGDDNGGADPQIVNGALGDNGGSVQTVQLNSIPNPAVVDAGNVSFLSEATFSVDLNGDGDTTDVIALDGRGAVRDVDIIPPGGTPDLGAVELADETVDPTGALGLIVTTADDVVNANDGVISLREAVALVNQAGDVGDDGTDTITFDESLAGQLIDIDLGELVVSDAVNILGLTNEDGAADINLDAGGESRIFQFINGHDVALENLVLSSGIANSDGGAIAANANSLTITNSVFRDNIANRGGAIATSDDLTIIDSYFTLNFASNISGGGSGGAVYAGGGSLNISGSTFSGNFSVRDGGAIAVDEVNEFIVTNSTIADNVALYSGGGFRVRDPSKAVIYGSTFSGNLAGLHGGGLYAEQSSPFVVTNSTFVGNYARYYGGGISTDANVDFIGTNLTITGNAAGSYGGGIGTVSGVYNNDNLYLYNSIVFGNSADTGGDLYTTNHGAYGANNLLGDVASSYGVNGYLGNPQLSGNADGLAVTDVFARTADPLAQKSLFGIIGLYLGFGTDFNPSTEGGLLADLSNNGGQVQTVLLNGNFANPALDASDPFFLREDVQGLDLNGDGDTNDVIGMDARGLPRDVDFVPPAGTPDLGALELQADETTEARSLVVTIADDIFDLTDGETSLREAVIIASESGDFGNDGLPDVVTFDASLAGEVFILTQGALTISDDATVRGLTDGEGNAATTIDGNDESQIFQVVGDGITVGLENLILQNCQSSVTSFVVQGILPFFYTGDISDFVGGAVFSDGANLTISNSTIQDSSSLTAGGIGIYGGSLSLQNSTVSGNNALRGGGIAGFYGDVTVYGSRVENNNSYLEGGGILQAGGSSPFTGYEGYSRLEVINSTVSGNDTFTGSGGGIYQTGGSLLVSNSTISDNYAGTEEERFGGGIYFARGDSLIVDIALEGPESSLGTDANTVTIYNSTISGNRAGEDGGGIYNDSGSLYVTNTTIAGNAAVAGQGGGIYSFNGYGVTVVTNSTITGNYAESFGGGIAAYYGVDLRNSLVLGNYAGTDGNDVYSYSGYTSQNSLVGVPGGYDISDIFDTTNAFIDLNSDGINDAEDPDIENGALADNGGDVLTVLLNDDAANPALAAGDANFLVEGEGNPDLNGDGDLTDTVTIDARGEARGTPPDLGAVEIGDAPEADSLVVTTTDDVVDAFDGETSLREAIALTNQGGDALGDGQPDIITFDASLAGLTITLVGGELAITDDVTIRGLTDGEGGANITISGDDASRIFNNSANTGLENLNLTNGFTLGYGGGIYTTGDLSVSNSTISNGYSRLEGGGINARGSDGANIAVTISDTTISENRSDFDGAGIDGEFADITITGSTVSGNEVYTGSGGGVYSIRGSLIIANSEISGNTASFQGGGIRSDQGLLTVVSSLISDNSSDLYGGGIYDNGTAVITNTTIVGNTAFSGGGIRTSFNSVLTGVNLTVTGNYAGNNGGGIETQNLVYLYNSLLLGNGDGENGGNDLYSNGGIYGANNVVGYFHQSGENGAFDGNPQIVDTGGEVTAVDVFDAVNSFIDLDGNGNDNGGTEPQFANGALADNGGPVETVLLLSNADNPALDAGDADFLSETTLGIDLNGDGDLTDTITLDARGLPRDVDVLPPAGTPDLGAVELQDVIDTGGVEGDLIIGTPQEDVLNGTVNDDTFRGLQRNDILNGLGGNDRFEINGNNAGRDTIDGGTGTDTWAGGANDDVFNVLGNFTNLISVEIVDGGDGYDVILGSNRGDVLDFSSAPFSIFNIEEFNGNRGDDIITGTNSDDRINGGRGADVLNGLGGDDIFFFSGGIGDIDIMDGGAGTDSWQGSVGDDAFFVTSNFGNLTSVEIVDGLAGSDTVVATAGADILDLNNLAFLLRNIEAVDSGAGADNVALSDTLADIRYTGGADDDSFVLGIQNAVFTDFGTGADTVDVGRFDTNFAALDDSDGGEGDGVLDADDSAVTVINGNLTLSLTHPFAGVVNFTFLGRTSLTAAEVLSDAVLGQTIIGTNAVDILNGGSGRDVIDGRKGDDALNGNGGSDIFVISGANKGLDTLDGGAGTDTWLGSDGDDIFSVTSGFGNLTSIEIIDGRGGNDAIRGTQFNDVLDFSSVAFTIVGIEIFAGGKGNDIITGTAGDDIINGERDQDTLFGLAGNDTFLVVGGTGDIDIMDGGTGSDIWSGTAATDDDFFVTSNFGNLTSVEVIDGLAGFDRIIGTSADDVFDFDAAGITPQNIERLNAGAGDDMLHTSDTVSGIAYEGGAGDDTFVLGLADATIFDFTGDGTGTSDLVDFTQYSLVFDDLDTNGNDVLDTGDDDVADLGGSLQILVDDGVNSATFVFTGIAQIDENDTLFNVGP